MIKIKNNSTLISLEYIFELKIRNKLILNINLTYLIYRFII